VRTPFALAAVVAALALGIVLGGHPDTLPAGVRDLLVGDRHTRVVDEAIDRVHDGYYRPISEQRLADAAIAGVVRSLDDRFSQYFDPSANRAFREETDNAYEGIGIEVAPDRRGLRVVTVYAGSPARRAGLRRADLIVAAGGASLAGRSVEAASRAIRGRPGTVVALEVLRAGRRRSYRVRRAQVQVPVVASSLRTVRGRRIGVVALANFESGANAQLRRALRRLRRRGARGYVLDLRGNGGGLVTQAQLVASAFLRRGPIVTTRGRAVPSETLSATGDAVAPTQPLAVLVDHDTASASEIVTGALQDRGRATVVGARTFGKGVFQTVVELSNGGALKITEGQYFTPKGRKLGGIGVRTGKGIAPDVPARDDPRTPRDEALVAALGVVAGALARR
jgi:carboxyl-terminal processing protease